MTAPRGGPGAPAGPRPPSTRARRTGLRVPAWVRVTVPGVLAVVLVWRVVVPQYAGAVAALQSLERVPVVPVLAAVALEVASLLTNSLATAIVLGRGRPRYGTLLRIDLATLGVGHVVPGGALAAAAVRYRLFVRAGVEPQEALSAAAIQATGSNLVLGALFAAGLVLALAAARGNALVAAAGVVVVVLVLATSGAVWAVTGHTDRAVAVARRAAGRVRWVDPESVVSFLATFAARTRDLAADPRRAVLAVTWAAANWLLDAAALWMVLHAFGFTAAVPGLLTVYGVGGILALVPVTPGGLGIVESAVVPALGALGAPLDTALLAVVGWRLLEFWIPIPVGLVAWVSLRLGVLRRPARGPVEASGASDPGRAPAGR